MEKKIISILFLITCMSFFIGCGASNQGSPEQKQWKHFKIELTVQDTKEVDILQDSLGIKPHLSSVILCVNITDPIQKYFVFGDEQDPKAFMYPWIEVPKSTRDYLLNYTGPKKIKLKD